MLSSTHAEGITSMASNMRSVIICISSVLLASCGIFGQAQSNAIGTTSIGQFKIQNRPVIEAILEAGAKARVPLGLILVDGRLCKDIANSTMEHATLMDVLNGLLEQLPDYKAEAGQDTILVTPKELPENTKKFLDLVVPVFRAPEGSLNDQLLYLSIDIRAVLKPSEGSVLDILKSPGSRVLPAVSLSNATVRQVLDILVLRPPRGEWILFPVPQDITTTVDKQFAQLYSYGDDEKKLNTPCEDKTSSN
jgi:hypothetical protein